MRIFIEPETTAGLIEIRIHPKEYTPKIKKKEEKRPRNEKEIKIDLSKIKIPAHIQRILKGKIKDGRKRALFILATFFSNYKGKPLISFEKFKDLIKKWNSNQPHPFTENELSKKLEEFREFWRNPKYKTPSLKRKEWWDIEFYE
jgi:hypothetical protein